MRDASHDDPRGIVVLCMSLTAGIALAVEAVWAWLPWLLVGAAAAVGAYWSSLPRASERRTRERRDGRAGAD